MLYLLLNRILSKPKTVELLSLTAREKSEELNESSLVQKILFGSVLIAGIYISTFELNFLK